MIITKENLQNLDFDKGGGLIPAIVQNAVDGDVLMLGYMNAGAVLKTLEEGKVTFWSRSKDRYWTKGESSGHYLHLESITADCDQDALLVLATPQGPTCHTGASTCFSTEKKPVLKNTPSFLSRLFQVILDRKMNPREDSYTNLLMNKGINKVAQKVGEEAVELVIEAKDENKDLFLNESADLMYHFMVLLVKKGYTLEEVEEVLFQRHNK